MNANKTGKFIKELRVENNLTQDDLANKLYVSRQVISNIELGKTFPSQSNIENLSKLFKITAFEIYSGEKIESESKELVDSTINEITTTLSSRLKKTIKIFIIIILVILSAFLVYYFFNSYNSVKIYNIIVDNENYKTTEGTFILTKDYINFKLNIEKLTNTEFKELVLHYKTKNEDKMIVKIDDLELNLIDYYGYEAYFDYDSIIKNKGDFYIEIIDEENNIENINLKLNKVYENKKLIFKKNQKMTTEEKYEYQENIPEKIKKSFNNNGDSYTLNIEKAKYKANLTYLIDTNQFIATEEFENYFVNWIYDLDTEIIYYSKYNYNNDILEESSIDITNITIFEKEAYNYFNKNYLMEYISND